MLTSLEMIDSPRLAGEERRGERSWILPGAAASCHPAMASPQCHFTSDGAPNPSPVPRLLSAASCCNQHGPWLHLGRWAQCTLIMGPVQARSTPVWGCVAAEWEGDLCLCVGCWITHTFSHSPLCSLADRLYLHGVWHVDRIEIIKEDWTEYKCCAVHLFTKLRVGQHEAVSFCFGGIVF